MRENKDKTGRMKESEKDSKSEGRSICNMIKKVGLRINKVQHDYDYDLML